MNRYIVLYLAPESVAERFARATPQEAQAGMRLWLDWAERLGPALVDLGKPLGNAKRLTAAGMSTSDSRVIGMSIIQAQDMGEAVTLTQDHHHLRWADDCEIVLLEEMPIPEQRNENVPQSEAVAG